MANIGYIRVSSQDQNTGRQFQCFEDAGIRLEKVFEEKASGKNIADRPQLRAMMNYLREGDVLHIESISRLARSTADFLTLVRELGEKGVAIRSLKENFDTSTAQGKFVLTMFAALYELERENIRERQREGIALCLAQKRPYGRPRATISSTFAKNYKRWKAGELKASEFMRIEGLARTTFYKLVKRYEEEYKPQSVKGDEQ